MAERLSRDGVTFLVRAMINVEEAHMGSSGDPYGVRAVRAAALRAVLDAYEAQRDNTGPSTFCGKNGEFGKHSWSWEDGEACLFCGYVGNVPPAPESADG